MSLFRGDQANDITTNSSSKTFTVASGEEWAINSIYVAYTTNATVGNRWVTSQLLAADNTVLDQTKSGLTQAASLTYNYSFSLGFATETSLYNNHLVCPLPNWIVTGGQKIKIFDSAAIDASGVGENLLVYVNRFKRKF